jgi:hypothetical protein
MLKKVLITAVLIVLLAGCATCKGVPKPNGQDRGEPPVFLDSYAPAPIRPGTSWRVYLKAHDADGDINYIAAVLWQAGFGKYTTDFTYVKGADREGFAGYLLMQTPADNNLLVDDFKLEVLLRDCQGNRSESVHLPLSFSYKSNYRKKQVPEQWQTTASRRLGVIFVEIESSEKFNSQDGGGGGRRIR